MTGPEHHREAEGLIELARRAGIEPPSQVPGHIDVGAGLRGRTKNPELYDHDPSNGKVRNLLADAQVHATLALAAATVALGGATASTPGPQFAPPPRHVTLRPDPGDDEDLP